MTTERAAVREAARRLSAKDSAARERPGRHLGTEYRHRVQREQQSPLAHYRELLLLSGQLRSLALPSGWRRPGAVRS